VAARSSSDFAPAEDPAGGAPEGQRRRPVPVRDPLDLAEQRFRSYFELGLIGVALTSPSKGCIEVNDEICRILGYERHELLKMSWAELTHPDDLAADVAQFNRVLSSEIDGYSMDKRWIRKDGQIVHSIISVKCVRALDGSVDHFVSLLQDITDRKRAEEKLRVANERLFVATRGSGIAVWEAEFPDGIFEHARIQRIHFDQFGLHGTAEYGEMMELVHPDDRERVHRTIHAYLAGETPHYEVEHRFRDGYGAERWVLSRGVVTRDSAGRPIRLTGTTLDITDRKRIEQSLHESESSLAHELASMARLQGVSTRLVQAGDDNSLLQNIVDAAIAITAADMGNIQLLERESDALKIVASRGFERPFVEFFDGLHAEHASLPDVVRGLERIVVANVATSPIFAGTPALNVLSDAGVRALQRTPLVTRAGRLLGMLSTHYRRPPGPDGRDLRVLDLLARQAADWIERQQIRGEREKLLSRVEAAHREAESANQAKDDFLAMLGHELRNPLTAILATLQSLRLEGSRALREERILIEAQSKVLADMVDDLLDVSRIARGHLKLVRRHVELSRIVARSVEMTRPLVEDRRHRLRVDVSESLTMNADERRMVQVVSNLISNAAKYTNPAGTIEVTGKREGRQAVLRVRDDGVGIPAALLPRVFDRFTQGPRTIDRGQGGLGLGLSIVHNLVRLHGGSVAASSEGPGRGAEFTVRIPLARGVPVSDARSRRRKSPAARVAEQRSVLLVDDNREITDVLARILRSRGHAVEVAYDGSEALGIAGRFHPRFAIIDIGLPEMNGYQLARKLKRLLPSSPPTLLALTGYGQLSDRKRALRAGFSDHLVKPIDLERLLAILEA
jgi:PAS domain S-box-containing protein